MSVEENTCPKCNSPYAYPDGLLWICPECAHEWAPDQASDDSPPENVPRFLDDPVNGHDISCKIAGFGAMYLKCSVVKKA